MVAASPLARRAFRSVARFCLQRSASETPIAGPIPVNASSNGSMSQPRGRSRNRMSTSSGYANTPLSTTSTQSLAVISSPVRARSSTTTAAAGAPILPAQRDGSRRGPGAEPEAASPRGRGWWRAHARLGGTGTTTEFGNKDEGHDNERGGRWKDRHWKKRARTSGPGASSSPTGRRSAKTVSSQTDTDSGQKHDTGGRCWQKYRNVSGPK